MEGCQADWGADCESDSGSQWNSITLSLPTQICKLIDNMFVFLALLKEFILQESWPFINLPGILTPRWGRKIFFPDIVYSDSSHGWVVDFQPLSFNCVRQVNLCKKALNSLKFTSKMCDMCTLLYIPMVYKNLQVSMTPFCIFIYYLEV